MRTALDTNVLVALWNPRESFNIPACNAVENASTLGSVVISAPVYCELLAEPGRSAAFLNRFFNDALIFVDWTLDEPIWRLAADAFRAYVERRRKQGDAGPRRALADFLIGAHAENQASRLLTRDAGFFRSYFPALQIVVPG